MSFRYNLTSTANNFVLVDDNSKRFVDPQIQNAVHVDLEMAYMRKYRPTGDITISTNNLAIKQSVLNIIKTNPGEMMHLPNFGAGLVRELFENVTPENANGIKSKIETAIEIWEPRVSLDRVVVQPDPENNAYYIDVAVIIIETNESINFQDNLIATRV